ncbi:MAG TPA: SIS domain-containing protein [Terriglobia bacterium]|nr:SIS domain-containing protein [Terriglobia bacterium]
MNIHAVMRELPEVLQTVATGRVAYDKAIREARWAEGPVTIIASHESLHAARAGAEVLEFVLGWPAAAREANHFRHYSLATLRPRSIVIVISGNGEAEEVVSTASLAARQGANVLAATWKREGALAKAAREVLPLPPSKKEFAPVTDRLAEHAAMLEIAVAAAKIFNPRTPRLEEIEFDRLPEHAASMNLHLDDPIRSMALQIKGCRRLIIASGGFYHAPAREAAALARRITMQPVEAMPVEAVWDFSSTAATAQDAFLFLSGSRCRLKKAAHVVAARLAASGAKVFAATDANDRELIESASFSVLAPETEEITSSLLSLILLQRLILECSLNAPLL